MTVTGGAAAQRWADELAAWAIPDEILAQAPESPWGFPTEVFAAAARDRLETAPTPTRERVVEALPAGGILLDVGAGGGAASLPAAPPAGRIVAVDPSPQLLEAMTDIADGRVAVDRVVGTWPDVADQVPVVDVAVCANVFYNVAELAPFVQALAAKARHRVVVELTERHPLTRLSPLWQRFWDLDRPTGPSADDALAVVVEALGVEPRVDRWTRTGAQHWDHDRVPWMRRRLCLPPERDAEVEDAMRSLPVDTAMVTFSWANPGAR